MEIDVNELCSCPLGTETDKRNPITPDKCFYCGCISPKFVDLKRPLFNKNSNQIPMTKEQTKKWM